MSIQSDYFHIVVELPPYMIVAEVLRIFKGGTSRVLRKEYPEMQEFLWGKSFWADGYFVEIVEKVDEEVGKKYIRQQQGNP